MQQKNRVSWTIRIVTSALAALVGLSATYWVLRGADRMAPLGTPAAVPLARQAVADTAAVARALGGGQAPAAPGPVSGAGPEVLASSRYVLTGVLAGVSQGGAALVSVDGGPPRPVRVGQSLEGGLVLQSVSGRRAVLATSLDAPAQITLELPPLPR